MKNNFATFLHNFKGKEKGMNIKKKLRKRSGFTLIEMLIVVILLGILAMLVVPQISVTTSDAELNTLQANLSSLRNSIELYYHQHSSTYPGGKKNDGTALGTAGDAATAFLQQLTQYTDKNGKCATAKNAAATPPIIFGPYLKGIVLPTNPFNSLNTVLCDIATDDITARVSDATTGWKFYTLNGVLMANDGAHDSN